MSALPPASFRFLPPLARGSIAGLALLLVAAGAKLAPAWLRNPDLSHGFFVPPIFALLLWESRRQGPWRWWHAGPRLAWMQAGALAGGVGLFGFAGLLAASVSWSHDLVNFTLAASLGLFLFAGLLFLSDRGLRLVPFNWISLTAVFLWLLAAPLPHGTYMRLTLELQAWVTSGVIHTLHLLGIPARQTGNVIHLAAASVGVEEACSGIRSLLSCVFAGFFFSAWLVRGRAGRALLILGAPVLAIGMNFFRSLALTLLVNAGVTIEGFWHDVTGFAILGLTALCLALVAIIVESKPAAPAASAEAAPRSDPAPGMAWRLLGSLGLVAGLAIFFGVQLRPAARATTVAPDLAALLPAAAPGWQVRTPKDLFRFSAALQSEHLAERTYGKLVDGKILRVDIYVAYWAPAQVPVSFVATHTPDACWPGGGWTPVPVRSRVAAVQLSGRTLPRGEFRQFTAAGSPPENVWFWHLYDGRAINYEDPYSVPALVKIALKYGFRREGEQMFVRVSSNAGWDRLASEPLVQQVFAGLREHGL